MRGQKKRRIAGSKAAAQATAEDAGSARWGELPRELVAIIASYTCEPVGALPFTCLSHDPGDSCAYHRLEDPAFAIPGAQFALGDQPTALSDALSGSGGGAGSALSGSTDGAGPSGSAVGAGTPAQLAVAAAAAAAAIPGTFRPARMSDGALAMRAVCRSWCEVLSEGVCRLLLQDPQPFTLWPSHFPRLTHLALGPCTDLTVRQTGPAVPRGGGAGSGDGADGGGDGDRAGPGPSSIAAAAAAAAAGRRRSRRGTAAATTAVGAAATGGKVRSLAALATLRNLQVMDTTVQLDLAASCSGLEELVVVAQNTQHHHMSLRDTPFLPFGPPPGGGRRGRGAGGGGGAAAPVVSRRSALDSTLGCLPGLQRLRFSGVDASAARLGSALMALTGLTSLRLHQCNLPTFLAAPPRARARAGSANFGRELVTNLGSKLLDLSLQNCHLTSLPPEVLAGLTHLRCLDLSANWMTELPHTVTQLVALEYLDLQQNALGSLPAGLPALSRLADLDLSSNQLHRLPPDFGGLLGLTHLNLSGNHSMDMRLSCSALASLTNLHSLGLCDIDLSADPFGPFAPPPLGGPAADPAAAASGPLGELVAALGPVGRLRELLLDGCGLDTLPANISALTQLSHLSIMENFDAAGLPQAVSSLRGLAVLRLGYLDLAAPLPAGLFELTGLRELDVEQNFLPFLDRDISKLSNLQVLNLVDAFDPDAQAAAVPWASLYRLTRLRHLSVTLPHDEPERVARGIGALAGLELLYMRGIPTPAAVLEELVSCVSGLTSLDLSSAGITSLPNGFSRLTRLTDLQLSGNRLSRLPAGFGALTRLWDLSLSYNPLRSLPADITRLCRLRSLSLSVTRAASAPSPPQLAWMARVPELVLLGGQHLADMAKAHKIAWPKRVAYY